MSPRRRLTGIAAMSAVTLASAGIAGSTVAAEEPDGSAELRALIEAFGGGEVQVPEEAMAQILSTLEAMGVDPAMVLGMADPEMLAALGASGLTFPKVEDAGESDELDPQADLFAKIFADAAGGEGIDEDAFLKMILGSAGLDGSDSADAFAKLIMGEMGLDEATFPELEDFAGGDLDAFDKADPILNVQEALAEAAAQGDIDAATLQSILELLPEE